MENDRKPSDVKRESSEDDNVNGFRWPLVSGQNSNAIPVCIIFFHMILYCFMILKAI